MRQQAASRAEPDTRLFEAAFHLEFRRFWQNKMAVFGLAIPGLIAAVALTTLLLVPVVKGLDFVEQYSIGEGLVFAALIAACDPIAVVALFKSVGAPKRIAVLIEGESLLNDGTAVVLFTLVLAFVVGKPTSLAGAAVDFVRVVGMGVLIGGAIGYAVSAVIHKVDDPMIEITLTTIAAYGSFVAAEQFHERVDAGGATSWRCCCGAPASASLCRGRPCSRGAGFAELSRWSSCSVYRTLFLTASWSFR